MMTTTVSAKPDPPAGLEATPPERFLDTRITGERFQPESLNSLPIAGLGDVPADALAVIVNLTMVDPAGPGFLSAVPTGELAPGEFPRTSNVNYDDSAAPNIANSAIIPLPESGTIDIYVSVESHVLVDVLGYVPADAGYSPIAPKRTLDTRLTTRPVAGSTTTAVVGADAPEGATLAIVNLTMDQSEEWGYLTAWPTGSDFPPTSNVNVFGPGQTRAGLSILPIGDDDSINLFTFRGADLIVDVFGYFDETGFDALDPFPRIYDSRALGARVPAGGQVDVQVAGVQGIPAGATAVFATITATDASDPGFVTVWPSGLDQPEASNLNYATGGTIANTVLVPLGADGKISIFTQSEIDLIVDVIGSF